MNYLFVYLYLKKKDVLGFISIFLLLSHLSESSIQYGTAKTVRDLSMKLD